MWKSQYRVIERLVVPVAKKTRLQKPSVRNASSNYNKVTDVIKDKATQAFQRGSSAATDAFQNQKSKAINAVRETSDSMKDQVQKGSHQVSKAASDAVRATSSTVSHQVKSATKTASDASYRAVSNTTETIKASSKNAAKDASERIQSATKTASDASYRAVSNTTETIKASSKAAAKDASERIRKTTFGVLGNAQESGKKVLRWIWWWSLAAIGVYGIASTVPRELVRYALEGDGKKKEEGNDLTENKENKAVVKKKQEGSNLIENKDSNKVVIGDTLQGWASWIACVTGSSKECARLKDDEEEKTASDRWRVPWNSGETPEKKSIRPS
jgi:ElaB/YqjD/DUF883 family membrane-anchored ribosome-binding protein